EVDLLLLFYMNLIFMSMAWHHSRSAVLKFHGPDHVYCELAYDGIAIGERLSQKDIGIRLSYRMALLHLRRH
ncbi:MAG: hypothetical protein AAFO69_21690, partial [Bacteroidota bacterium]